MVDEGIFEKDNPTVSPVVAHISKPPEHKEFGDRLRELMKEQGLKTPRLAQMMNTTFATVRRWENGQCSPRPNMMDKLSAVLGAPLHQLTGSTHKDINSKISPMQMKMQRIEDLQRQIDNFRKEIDMLKFEITQELQQRGL